MVAKDCYMDVNVDGRHFIWSIYWNFANFLSYDPSLKNPKFPKMLQINWYFHMILERVKQT